MTSFLQSSADGLTLTVGGFTSLIPDTTDALALGSATKAIKSLTLQNGSTDGGAIYFDAGSSTKFLKCNAAGTELSTDLTLRIANALHSGGTNTFNITNGTASLDVAAGSAVDVNANLTVEAASTVNQDLTSDATPTFAAINIGDTNLSDYKEGTFTPTVTLVGGSGNTVPVYATNAGRYTRIGNRVIVDIYLNGDGGNEGAGSGVINIALPFTVGASAITYRNLIGKAINSTTHYFLGGSYGAGSTTVALWYQSSVSALTDLTGALQNNTTRQIMLSFAYEI